MSGPEIGELHDYGLVVIETSSAVSAGLRTDCACELCRAQSYVPGQDIDRRRRKRGYGKLRADARTIAG